MAQPKYPLLCWQLTPELVGGQLVGEDICLVSETLKKLKASISTELK